VSTTRKVIYLLVAGWLVISAPLLVADLLIGALHLLQQLGQSLVTVGNSLSHSLGGGGT
jgi:hypothetical protein